jgi:hypothetical protein
VVKRKVAWGVFTEKGRLRSHVYLKRRAAKEDAPFKSDRVRKVEIRYSDVSGGGK